MVRSAGIFGTPKALPSWWPVLAGLAVLYVPTYLDLYRVYWRTRQGAHGPLLLAVVIWLFWRQRACLASASKDAISKLGIVLFACGLLTYILGRSQSFYQLETLSQIPLIAGVACLLAGPGSLRRLWFPLLMLCFVVPIPGSMLDELLVPLKEWVSGAVDSLLHAAGYPIARNGVVLSIGHYNLLIADACSGLNSMIALTGIGLIYVYVAGHSRRSLNAVLLLAILPIAFIANVIRVLVLVLLTYYGGEALGNAFHDHAGYLEIVLAFGGFFALERLLLFIGARAAPNGLPRGAEAAT